MNVADPNVADNPTSTDRQAAAQQADAFDQTESSFRYAAFETGMQAIEPQILLRGDGRAHRASDRSDSNRPEHSKTNVSGCRSRRPLP